jgi:hypothetical protein
MNILKIKKAAEIAKSRTSDKRWLVAIDKAVAGVESGWWIVTELATCLAITTETGNTYFANGVCQCEAYLHSTACKHRALYRLIQIAHEIEETTTPAVSPTDEEVIADVEASSRKQLIAEIENIWPRFAPGAPLAVELMARFRVNKLEMLDDDMLRRVRLAIAM